MRLMLFIIAFGFFNAGAQTKQDSTWAPFKRFIGEWKGASEGEPGQGRYERTYSFVLNNKFIEVINKSSYPATEKNPKGEVHEDHGFLSYDKARRVFVLRQFHLEGFVNQYKLESMSADRKTIVFISEAIENIPAGFRAKETYHFTGEDEFTETFELAEPGKDFQVYSKAFLKKSQ
jgi:hypothetical protein